MDRQQIVNAIQSHRDSLKKLGVARLALFGSIARNDIRPSSDIDVIVDSPDGEAFGMIRLLRTADELEGLLDRKVDIFSQRGVNNAPDFRARISSDLIDVF
jgi:predicted nucleotidyltransferase